MTIMFPLNVLFFPKENSIQSNLKSIITFNKLHDSPQNYICLKNNNLFFNELLFFQDKSVIIRSYVKTRNRKSTLVAPFHSVSFRSAPFRGVMWCEQPLLRNSLQYSGIQNFLSLYFETSDVHFYYL